MASLAVIGFYCDYSTCFTNLTHFPELNAQMSFTYAVPMLITPAIVLLPAFLSMTTVLIGRCSCYNGLCLCAEDNLFRLQPVPGSVPVWSWRFLVTFQYLSAKTFIPYTFINTLFSVLLIAPVTNIKLQQYWASHFLNLAAISGMLYLFQSQSWSPQLPDLWTFFLAGEGRGFF